MADESPPDNTTVRETVVRHLPALLAGGAVVLYILGIVSTVGALRATNLDVPEVLGLIPLETHLRNGISVVTDPIFLIVVASYVAIYFIFVEPRPEADNAADKTPDEPERGGTRRDGWLVLVALLALWRLFFKGAPVQAPPPAAKPKKRRLRRLAPFAPIGLAALVVIGLPIVVSPWPLAVFTLLSALVWAAPWIALRTGVRSRRQLGRIYVASAVSLSVVVAFLDAYFRSDPLPMGRVTTASHVMRAPIIASDGGFLYLGPSKPERAYFALPTTKVVSFTATPRTREEEPTVPELLGLSNPPDPKKPRNPRDP